MVDEARRIAGQIDLSLDLQTTDDAVTVAAIVKPVDLIEEHVVRRCHVDLGQNRQLWSDERVVWTKRIVGSEEVEDGPRSQNRLADDLIDTVDR